MDSHGSNMLQSPWARLRAFTSAKFATWPEIFFWDPNRIPTRRCAEDALNLQIQRPPRLAEKTWNDVVSRRQNYQRLSAYNINLYINHQKSWYVHVWSVCVLCIYMYNIYMLCMYSCWYCTQTNVKVHSTRWRLQESAEIISACARIASSLGLSMETPTLSRRLGTSWNILEHYHILYIWSLSHADFGYDSTIERNAQQGAEIIST